jgi:flagellar biogenesis protein FliO
LNALDQVLAALFFCGLLALLVWLVRKGKLAPFSGLAGAAHSGEQLDVLARRALTPQHTLHLVVAAGQTLLIATHPHGAEIATLPAARRPLTVGPDREGRAEHC